MKFTDKVAVVSGASRGIGREIVIRLVGQGAQVVAVGRSEDALRETKRLTSNPDRVSICPADLRNDDNIRQIADIAHKQLGTVDILMNIAGVWHSEDRKFQGPRTDQTAPAEIDEVLGVGFRGSYHLTRTLLPDLIQKRAGKVLFVSCGFAGPHEARGWVHYYVTNKAIEALTEGLASELREFEVQVNCVAPWFVASEAVRRFYPEESQLALETADVAKIALFLVSSEADHISGEVIEVRSKRDR